MFSCELKKYIKNRAFWLLAILAVVLKAYASWASLTVRADFPKDIYREYMNILEGKPTEEKEEWISDEQERLTEALGSHTLYEELYTKGEITLEEYIERNDEYIYAQAQEKAFEAVLEKNAYFHGTDGNVQFFYDLEILQFFKSCGADYVLIFFLCFAIAAVYELENRSDMRRMICALPLGRKRFWQCKLRAALLVGTVAACFGGLMDLIIYGGRYSFSYMNMPAQSIRQMGGIMFALPVWCVFLFLLLSKMIIAAMMTAVICLLSVMIKKFVLTAFTSAVLFGTLSLFEQYIPGIGGVLLQNQMVKGRIFLHMAVDMGIVLCVSFIMLWMKYEANRGQGQS